MSNKRQAEAAPLVTMQDRRQKGFRRIHDPLDEPARALLETSAAIHARRRSKARVREGALSSQACAVAFNIRATANGLLVERTQSRHMGACLVQTLVFEDVDRFQRWCEAEPMRFDDPLLFDRLRREGHEVLCGQR